METIALGATGRQTSRLGYGCSRLMDGVGGRESQALLEAAFAAGVRHFDVAAAYGQGLAEGCVGEFHTRHRGEITLATKYGVPIHKQSRLKFAARQMAQPVFAMLPGLKRRLQKAAKPVSSAPGPREWLPFTPELVRASIERSLVALKTEHIDLFLLHEVEAGDLADDGVLRMLEEMVTSGKVGAFGAAGGAEKVPALMAQRPAYCRVMQHEWSVLDPKLPVDGTFRLLYRSLSVHFDELLAALKADAARARRWSDAVGADVANGETLSRLMLKAALVANPESVILFSSKRRQHIAHNVASVDTAGSAGQAERLYGLVRAEAREVLPNSRPAAEAPLRAA